MKLSELTDKFIVQEFVPKNVYNLFGDSSIRFLNPQIVIIADCVRNYFDRPVTINNWYWGGALENRGYREPLLGLNKRDSGISNHFINPNDRRLSRLGAYWSAHKSGCAIDISISGITPLEINQEIIDNSELFMRYGLTALEDVRYTPTWNHISCQWTGSDEILILKP